MFDIKIRLEGPGRVRKISTYCIYTGLSNDDKNKSIYIYRCVCDSAKYYDRNGRDTEIFLDNNILEIAEMAYNFFMANPKGGHIFNYNQATENQRFITFNEDNDESCPQIIISKEDLTEATTIRDLFTSKAGEQFYDKINDIVFWIKNYK